MATSEERLRELRRVLVQSAEQLERVRAELRRETEESRAYWQGNAADGFRAHTGGGHRLRHLAVAHRRLLDAAALAQAAVDDARRGHR